LSARFVDVLALRSGVLFNPWQSSSLGNYTTQWLNEFHWSARGKSAEDWLNEPKKRREKLLYPPVKIVFPTKKTVQESAAGELVSSSRCILSEFFKFSFTLHLGWRYYFLSQETMDGKKLPKRQIFQFPK